ncbi:hypothetical protein N0V83_004331 [Neocucurbitaria cava]|uniref:SRR1-like domain-containing protein n=1 Tax=Neocucurbitaria cava TaxID=798079 RepID=A0A9W9CMU0_9PLEO|nr:hypothetical protein N0V83_004331 [Neocucurbitaria cava]
MNFPRFDEKTAEEQKHVDERLDEFYGEIGTKPVYTKELIKYNADQFAKLTVDNTTISLMDMHGNIHKGFSFVNWFAHPKTTAKLLLRFLTYLDIASIKDNMFYSPGMLDQLAEARIPTYVLMHWDLEGGLNETELKQIEESWTKSETHKKIQSTLQKNNNTGNIKKIVCFGMGTLEHVSAYPGTSPPDWNLGHSLVALDAAQALKAKNKTTKSVPIIFQDPFYTQKDRAYLEKIAKQRGFKIEFIDYPYGFLEVDEYTLVLAQDRPEVPSAQVLADLTAPFGGPAGIFCRTITPITTAKQEMISRDDDPLHLVNRRCSSLVANMMEACTVDDWASTLYLKKTT